MRWFSKKRPISLSILPLQTVSARVRDEGVDCRCTHVLIQALSISTS